MITNVRIGKLPTTPFMKLHPYAKKQFLNEMTNYISGLKDETKYAVIARDFSKYFANDHCVPRMKLNSEYYLPFSFVVSDGDADVDDTMRPMYPKNSPVVAEYIS